MSLLLNQRMSVQETRKENRRELSTVTFRDRRLVTLELGIEASQARIVDQNGNALLSRRVAALGSLFEKSAVITGIGQALKDATIEYIISGLMSFHGQRNVY